MMVCAEINDEKRATATSESIALDDMARTKIVD
jgi:hypothetical protein